MKLRFFHQNVAIKLVCFFAAAILWSYVNASQGTTGKFPNNLKVKTINQPSGLVPILDRSNVEIKVMAEPNIWRQLSTNSFSAYLDLIGLQAGTFELPVTVISSVPGVQIVSRVPEKIIVTLEPLITKTVAVDKKIEGSAGQGLVAGPVEIEPKEVVARGPKSVIDNLSEASVTISLSGETNNFTKTLNIETKDGNELNQMIEFAPPEVTVLVNIVKASNNKTVGVKIKTTGSLKSGYQITAITTTPSTVDITGDQTLVDGISFIETEPLDLTGLTDGAEKELNLHLPSGVALQSGGVNKMRVKIQSQEIDITRDVQVTPTFINLENNLKVNTQNIDLKVTLSGTIKNLNSIKPGDVILNIDLAAKNTGTYNFDISPLNFKIPAGIVISSVAPASLEVVIEKK